MPGSNAYRAAQAYRNVSIAVSPIKAVIMLLDGAILSLQKSLVARETKRFEDSYNYVLRATTILRGLSHHLNPKKGEMLACQLADTYNALIVACLRAYGRADAPAHYHRLIASLSELRDAWVTVGREKIKAQLPG